MYPARVQCGISDGSSAVSYYTSLKVLTVSPVPRWFSAEFYRGFIGPALVQCGILTDAVLPAVPVTESPRELQRASVWNRGTPVTDPFDPMLGSARTVHTLVADSLNIHTGVRNLVAVSV
jgi:hypothetical protein